MFVIMVSAFTGSRMLTDATYKKGGGGGGYGGGGYGGGGKKHG